MGFSTPENFCHSTPIFASRVAAKILVDKKFTKPLLPKAGSV